MSSSHSPFSDNHPTTFSASGTSHSPSSNQSLKFSQNSLGMREGSVPISRMPVLILRVRVKVRACQECTRARVCQPES